MSDLNSISNRLSLRQPQRDSLEILARVCEIVSLDKSTDAAKALEIIKSEFPTVTDFERDFPSLCFALATGVGKTRLMGAFIAYLYQAEGIRHFFVLAPNLTIYNKLITDFTPNTSKYVFQGIGEFATMPPVIITGDNYENGLGVRSSAPVGHRRGAHQHLQYFQDQHRGPGRQVAHDQAAPGIHRDSYFEYLSEAGRPGADDGRVAPLPGVGGRAGDQ